MRTNKSVQLLLRTDDAALIFMHYTGIRCGAPEVMARIAAGEIDAAIVHLPVTGAGLQVTELFSEELLLIAPASHPLAGRDAVSLVELSEHPIIQPPPGTPQRRIVDRTAASAGVAMRSLAEIDGVRLMASLVFDGFGAAIVPASVVPSWLTGTFVRIAVPELPRRTVGWVQRERPRPNRATLAVRDMALDVISRHGPRQPGVTLSASIAGRPGATPSAGTTRTSARASGANRRPGNGRNTRV
jgi:LysR family hydrogen peroxide-inducible transcriptional activator